MPTSIGRRSSVAEITKLFPEQVANFTATSGKKGVCHEYPVDMRAFANNTFLSVTAPEPAVAGDCFAVFDSRLQTDNGVDFPGNNKNIRVNFVGNVHGQPGPEFAVINTAGARLEFLYIDASIGWRIASNVNT